MSGVLDNYLKWIVSMTSMTNSRITLELGPPPGETFSNFKIDTKTPKYQNGYKEPQNKTII